MALDPYRVVHHRLNEHGRVGEWSFLPIGDGPRDDDDDRLVPADCRCQERNVRESDIFADLDAGRRRRTLPAHHKD